MKSFDDSIVFVNQNDPSNSGLLNIVKYIFKIDCLFFNWIENVPERKGGSLQFLFLKILLVVLKSRKVKIIWTMHNKLSHTANHLRAKQQVFKTILKQADVVLTHSSEGIKFGEEIMANSTNKIFYFPHPVKDRRPKDKKKKKYDILIWGTISPYKGIDNFLRFLHEHKLQNNYKVLIVGKSTDEEHFKEILRYASNTIEVRNEFIEDDTLQQMIAESKIVLFTYSKASILSSGVLMDSLGYGANIVGPNTGAFADHALEGVLYAFEDYDDMIIKIDKVLSTSDTAKDQILDTFLINNSWKAFAKNVQKILH